MLNRLNILWIYRAIKSGVMIVISASLAIGLATGCGGPTGKSSVSVEDPGGPDLGKPFPKLGSTDVSLIAIDELAGVHRAVSDLFTLAAGKVPDDKGCINYKQREQGRMVVMQYKPKCRWQQAAPDSSVPMTIRQLGQEWLAARNRGSWSELESVSHQLMRVGTRSRKPDEPLFKLPLQKNVKVEVPSEQVPANFSYLVEASIKAGTNENFKLDAWEISIPKSFWQKKNGVVMEAGSKIVIAHRNPAARKNEKIVPTKIEILAETDISFSAECHFPLGEFSWQRTDGNDTGSGRVIADGEGLVDLAKKRRSGWITPCFEKLGDKD